MKTTIEMAREAGFMVGEFSGPWAGDTPVGEQLERFAALVRADEREQGRQEGMKQERALWKLSRLGQEIEAQPERDPWREAVAHPKIDPWREAVAHPEERNFCPRCGKRTADPTTVHTCTPPKDAR